jgi:hypothetical protein
MTLSPAPSNSALHNPEVDVEEVLAVLRQLAGRVGSPVVRECLQTAHADIAFLTGAAMHDPEGQSALCEDPAEESGRQA